MESQWSCIPQVLTKFNSIEPSILTKQGQDCGYSAWKKEQYTAIKSSSTGRVGNKMVVMVVQLSIRIEERVLLLNRQITRRCHWNFCNKVHTGCINKFWRNKVAKKKAGKKNPTRTNSPHYSLVWMLWSFLERKIQTTATEILWNENKCIFWDKHMAVKATTINPLSLFLTSSIVIKRSTIRSTEDYLRAIRTSIAD